MNNSLITATTTSNRGEKEESDMNRKNEGENKCEEKEEKGHRDGDENDGDGDENDEQPRNEIKSGFWTKQEHATFLSALTIYGRGEWEMIAKKVKTRTILQTRTHAQKYYQQLSKKKAQREGGTTMTFNVRTDLQRRDCKGCLSKLKNQLQQQIKNMTDHAVKSLSMAADLKVIKTKIIFFSSFLTNECGQKATNQYQTGILTQVTSELISIRKNRENEHVTISCHDLDQLKNQIRILKFQLAKHNIHYFTNDTVLSAGSSGGENNHNPSVAENFCDDDDDDDDDDDNDNDNVNDNNSFANDGSIDDNNIEYREGNPGRTCVVDDRKYFQQGDHDGNDVASFVLGIPSADYNGKVEGLTEISGIKNKRKKIFQDCADFFEIKQNPGSGNCLIYAILQYANDACILEYAIKKFQEIGLVLDGHYHSDNSAIALCQILGLNVILHVSGTDPDTKFDNTGNTAVFVNDSEYVIHLLLNSIMNHYTYLVPSDTDTGNIKFNYREQPDYCFQLPYVSQDLHLKVAVEYIKLLKRNDIIATLGGSTTGLDEGNTTNILVSNDNGILGDSDILKSYTPEYYTDFDMTEIRIKFPNKWSATAAATTTITTAVPATTTAAAATAIPHENQNTTPTTTSTKTTTTTDSDVLEVENNNGTSNDNDDCDVSEKNNNSDSNDDNEDDDDDDNSSSSDDDDDDEENDNNSRPRTTKYKKRTNTMNGRSQPGRSAKKNLMYGSSSSGSSSGTDDNDKCVICDNVGKLLICDGCERSYHLHCLDPPLEWENVPDGHWFCPQCSSKVDGNNNNSNNTSTSTSTRATSKKLEEIINDEFNGVSTTSEEEDDTEAKADAEAIERAVDNNVDDTDDDTEDDDGNHYLNGTQIMMYWKGMKRFYRYTIKYQEIDINGIIWYYLEYYDERNDVNSDWHALYNSDKEVIRLLTEDDIVDSDDEESAEKDKNAVLAKEEDADLVKLALEDPDDEYEYDSSILTPIMPTPLAILDPAIMKRREICLDEERSNVELPKYTTAQLGNSLFTTAQDMKERNNEEQKRRRNKRSNDRDENCQAARLPVLASATPRPRPPRRKIFHKYWKKNPRPVSSSSSPPPSSSSSLRSNDDCDTSTATTAAVPTIIPATATISVPVDGSNDDNRAKDNNNVSPPRAVVGNRVAAPPSLTNEMKGLTSFNKKGDQEDKLSNLPTTRRRPNVAYNEHDSSEDEITMLATVEESTLTSNNTESDDSSTSGESVDSSSSGHTSEEY